MPDGSTLPHHSLVVLDDLQSEQSKDTLLLHTVHSHHRNLTVICLNHSIFPKNRFQRDLTQSTKYIIVCKNPRDTQAFHRLALQLHPSHARSLYDAYLDACSRPYGYLLCDLTQEAHPALKYRSQLFPSDEGQCVYATDQELSHLLREHPHYVRYSEIRHSPDASSIIGQQDPQEGPFGLSHPSGDGRPL